MQEWAIRERPVASNREYASARLDLVVRGGQGR